MYSDGQLRILVMVVFEKVVVIYNSANAMELGWVEEYEQIDAVLDEQTLREIYLTGFEIAVKEAKPRVIMSSYNQVNETYAILLRSIWMTPIFKACVRKVYRRQKNWLMRGLYYRKNHFQCGHCFL